MANPIVAKPLYTKYEWYPGWANSIFYTLYLQKQRYVQKSPFNLVAPYSLRLGQYDLGGDPSSGLGSPRHTAATLIDAYYDSSVMALTTNKSYEKLKGEISPQAALGVDFAEMRQSFGMMVRTCDTLVRAARAIKNFQFLSAAQILKMHLVPPGASRKKSFANNWLEFHFGWEPLVSDIYDAVTVINNPLLAFAPAHRTARDYRYNYSYFYDFGSITDTGWWRALYQVTQGATVKAVDWNVHALDQFGVVNPLSIAWELVPYSFVVDWFVNVGEVLGSYSDYAGMTLDRTFTSQVYRVEEWGIIKPKTGSAKPRIFHGTSVKMTRTAGLTAPVLVSKVTLPSKERALTAVSLLIQVLAKK